MKRKKNGRLKNGTASRVTQKHNAERNEGQQIRLPSTVMSINIRFLGTAAALKDMDEIIVN
jgi:hypothetical protein